MPAPRLLLPLLLAAALLPAAAADANVPKYRMTISGTLTSTGTVSSTECYAPGADMPVAKQGAASSTVRFRTTRPALVFAQRMSTDGIAIGLADDDKPLRATATITDQSTLADRETPVGCGADEPKSDCGTTTLAFDIGVGGRGGIAPDFSKNSHKNAATFEQCPFTVGMAGFPSFTGGAGIAKVSARKLLGARKLTLKGGRKERDSLRTRTVTADGSYDLRYTIKLTRVQ